MINVHFTYDSPIDVFGWLKTPTFQLMFQQFICFENCFVTELTHVPQFKKIFRRGKISYNMKNSYETALQKSQYGDRENRK